MKSKKNFEMKDFCWSGCKNSWHSWAKFFDGNYWFLIGQSADPLHTIKKNGGMGEWRGEWGEMEGMWCRISKNVKRILKNRAKLFLLAVWPVIED